MSTSKQGIRMETFDDRHDIDVSPSGDIKKGTAADQQDMQRLGKTQETKVCLTMNARVAESC